MGHMFDGFNGDFKSMPDPMRSMMQNYYQGLAPFGSVFGFLELVTWILFLGLIVALIRYFWLKADKK
jgi:hypothetical protein